MKLILLESVDGLGRPGDEVKVKAGYARNYLIPERLALRFNADSARMRAKLIVKAEEQEKAMISSMEELRSKIQGQKFEIPARATDEGHLFGSVTEKDIHVAMLAANWDVPQRAVRLSAHIKEAGEHEIELHLHGEIQTTIGITVIPVDVEGHPIEIVAGDEAEATEATDEGGEEGDADAGAATEEQTAAADA